VTGFQRVILPSAATAPEQPSLEGVKLHLQKMVAVGELAVGMAHDFRNVLQTVISTLELLESRADDTEEVRRLTASALRASERGIALTGRILNFSRREAAAARSVCLLPCLESVREMLSRTLEARMNVRIELRGDDLWPVVVDPIEFELALVNLGLNARDAMPGGGRICFGARNVTIPIHERRDPKGAARILDDRRGPRIALPGGDYVTVNVDDTGAGMDEATLARAAEPFFTTKPVGKGTGLGLAMVHHLVTRAQGALRMMSKVDCGTSVQLWLPRGS
jgi:signal transduction histidine kinase